MNTKQVIVIRKDLNMRKGKMCAQAAHASLGALLKFFTKKRNEIKQVPFSEIEEGTFLTEYSVEFGDKSVLDDWLNGKFTKICVSVNSEEELLEIKNKLDNFASEGTIIPYALITDAGLTEFHGVPTNTCIGIGPYVSEEIDKITGNLPLL